MKKTAPQPEGRGATAKYLATLDDFRGVAKVYELSTPLAGYDEGEPSSRYVIVSAAYVPFSGPETYIFPAKKTGDTFAIRDWLELPGSYRGGLDHEEALMGAGYTVIS